MFFFFLYAFLTAALIKFYERMNLHPKPTHSKA